MFVNFVLLNGAEKPECILIDDNNIYYNAESDDDSDNDDDYREHLHLEFRTRHHSGLLFFTGL